MRDHGKHQVANADVVTPFAYSDTPTSYAGTHVPDVPGVRITTMDLLGRSDTEESLDFVNVDVLWA